MPQLVSCYLSLIAFLHKQVMCFWNVLSLIVFITESVKFLCNKMCSELSDDQEQSQKAALDKISI